jgi:hypothetical protein
MLSDTVVSLDGKPANRDLDFTIMMSRELISAPAGRFRSPIRACQTGEAHNLAVFRQPYYLTGRSCTAKPSYAPRMIRPISELYWSRRTISRPGTWPLRMWRRPTGCVRLDRLGHQHRSLFSGRSGHRHLHRTSERMCNTRVGRSMYGRIVMLGAVGSGLAIEHSGLRFECRRDEREFLGDRAMQ